MAAGGGEHYLSAVTAFESKRDAWLVGLLYLAACAELVGGVVILHGNAPQLVKPAGSLLIGGVLVILWVLNGIQYMIHLAARWRARRLLPLLRARATDTDGR